MRSVKGIKALDSEKAIENPTRWFSKKVIQVNQQQEESKKVYFIVALKKHADFTGRALGKVYWMFILIYMIIIRRQLTWPVLDLVFIACFLR